MSQQALSEMQTYSAIHCPFHDSCPDEFAPGATSLIFSLKTAPPCDANPVGKLYNHGTNTAHGKLFEKRRQLNYINIHRISGLRAIAAATLVHIMLFIERAFVSDGGKGNLLLRFGRG